MAFSDLVGAADRAVQGHLGGVPIVYRPQYENPVELVGMFDENYVLVDDGHAGVEQVGPVVHVRLEDLPVHPLEDEPIVTVADKTYRVIERLPDGLGGVRLRLHRVEG